MNALSSILAFGIVLGIIVLVHEFGHFIAARLMGVRVEVFSFGFGKRLFGKKIGETDFRLSLIPLGGFVKMAGEEEFDPNNMQPYEFHAKNRGQKIFILFMGPFMNLLLSFFIYTVINMTGIPVVKYMAEPPQIGYVKAGSPADQAGIQKYDLIKTVDGQEVNNWRNLELMIASSPNEALDVEFLRDGQPQKTKLHVKARTRYHIGDAGMQWAFKTWIGKVVPDSPAAKAGLKAEDVITSFNGEPITFFEFSDYIRGRAGQTFSMEVKRGEETFTTEITPQLAYYLESKPMEKKEAEELQKKVKELLPELNSNLALVPEENETETGTAPNTEPTDDDSKSETKKGKKPETYRLITDYMNPKEKALKFGEQLKMTVLERGMIGVGNYGAFSPSKTVHYGLWGAMVKSKNDITEMTFFIFTAFKKMIVGKISPKQLSGPIDIAKVSQKAMESGPTHLFILIAFISLQLSIVNLFPIPALDGGHLMIYSIEAIIRKDFSPNVKMVLMNIGFVLLLSLMAFVILNDIAKVLPNGWASFWPF